MACEICGTGDIIAKCIICEKELCNSCVVNCNPKIKETCVQKAGNFIVWRCPGTHCPTCATKNLIFTCKGCNLKFCRTVIDTWAKACPTCKDFICGFCYDQHIKTCSEFYDKEEALDKLYKFIEGHKEE